ncbi:2TM domain-containing protein [Flavobacteriaceae bacterium MAR_2010_188]|nr:2TM domain-containing protein [Flavobacteriaceae bacterium MAR_2010_188]
MKAFLKSIFIGFIIGLVLTIIGEVISFFETESFSDFDSLMISIKYQMLYGIVLSVVNSYWFQYATRTEKFGSLTKYRFFISFLGSVILTTIAIFFIRLYHEMTWSGESFSQFLDTEVAGPYIYSIMLTLVIGFIFYGFYYYREQQKTKVKEQTIIAGTASAKFDALKNQLDPHFLFNSLNVLTSLIEENPKNAQYFTTSLSKVYRYVLEQKNKELVLVDEELEFAKSYVSLLKMRFEDSIIFELPDHSENPESKVVPLSLQLLLENAVKHNTVTSTRPLKIKIYEENGYLVVQNNLQPKQILNKSTGVGLSNIKQRYELLTNRQIEIISDNNNFSVRLPMLSKQILMMRTENIDFSEQYVRARKHVDSLKEFYYSLVSYFVVMPFLIFINYKTFWGFQWFWFPLLGWGIGLIFQAYKIYVNDGVLGKSWEERTIEKYMREEEKKSRFNNF